MSFTRFLTWLLAVALVGGASILLQGLSGHDFGAYNGLVQALAAVAAESLAKADIPTQWHMSAGLGHGIDNGGLVHGGLFLAKAFGVRLPSR